MNNKKRYVQVGIGGRARFFYQAMAERFSDTCELTAICDINPIRMEYAKKNLMENFHYPEVKTYGVDEFEKMIIEQKPDYVLVTSIDRTHHKYIVKAMEMGCDVISEKPMTMDADKCQAILDAVKRTLSNLNVDAFDISGVSLYDLDNPPVKKGYTVDALYQDPLQTVACTAETGYAFATWKMDESILYMPDFADAADGALAPGWALSAKNSVWDSSKGEMTYGTGKGNLELSYDGNMAVYMHTGSSTQCYTSYPGMYYQLGDTQDAMVLSYDLTASSSVNLLNILMPSYLNVETGAFADLPLTLSFVGGAFTVTWDGTALVSGEKIMTTDVAKNFKIVAFSNAVDGGKEIGFALYLNSEYKCGGTKLVDSFPGFNTIRIWHSLSKNSKYTLSELEVYDLDAASLNVYNLDNPPVKPGYIVEALYQDPLQTVENTAATGYAFAKWKEDESVLNMIDFSGTEANTLPSGWALSASKVVWDDAYTMVYGSDAGNLELSYDNNMTVYMHSVGSDPSLLYTGLPGMYYALDTQHDSIVLSYDLTASASVNLANILMPSFLDGETGEFTDLPLTMSFASGAFTVKWDGETLVDAEKILTSNVAKNFQIVTFANPVAEGTQIGFELYLDGEYKCGGVKTVASFPGFNVLRTWFSRGDNSKFTIDDLMIGEAAAVIGDKVYLTLSQAMAAVQENDTVVMVGTSSENVSLNSSILMDMNGYNVSCISVAEGAVLTGMDSTNNAYENGTAGAITQVSGSVASSVAVNGRTYLAIPDGDGYSFHRYYLKTSGVGINANYMADDIMQPALFYQYSVAGDQAVLDAVDSVGIAYWIGETEETVLAQSALPETCAAGAMKDTAGELYTGQSAMVYGMLQEGQGVANAENIEKPVLGRAYICIGDTVIYSDNCLGNTMKHYIEAADAMWSSLVLSQKNSLTALYNTFPELMNVLDVANYSADTASAVSLLQQTLAEESTYTAVQTGGVDNTENVVENGDFEQGAAGWTGYSSSVFSVKTVEGNQVLSLARVTTTDGETVASTVNNPFVYRELDLAPGTRCNISFRYYFEIYDEAAAPCVYISCCDATGKELETVGVWPSVKVAGEWVNVSGQVDLPEEASIFRVRVRIRTTADVEAYFDDIVITPERIRLDTEDMFFYTDRAKDTVNFTAKVYDSDLSAPCHTVTFGVFDGEKQIWSGEPGSVTDGQAVQPFALANLTDVETPYTVVATAKDADGNVIYVQTQNIYMYYRPAAMAADGTFLSDGEPFYPVFGYGLSTEQIATNNISVENTINVARLGTYTSAEGAVNALDALQKKGMKGMICLHPGMRAAGSDRNMEQTIAVIGDPRVYNHPALFGYCVQDEAFLNYNEGYPLKDLENTYRLIRMFDNTHPILATENMPEHFDEVAQRLNCLILDQYSTAVSQEVYNEAVAASAATNKPVYALTQCYEKEGIWPTADELRNNHYQYLLGGCTGLGYYRLAKASGTGDIWDAAEEGGNPELWSAMQSFFTAEKDILMSHFGSTNVDAINQRLVKEETYWYYTFQANGKDYAVILGMMDSGASADAVVNGGWTGNTVTVIAGTDAAPVLENGILQVSVNGVEAILCQIN